MLPEIPSIDRLILVFYLNLPQDKVEEAVRVIKNGLPPDILAFFIPTLEDSKIECINPKLLTSRDEYLRIKKVLEETQEGLNNLMLDYSAKKKMRELFSEEDIVEGYEECEECEVQDLGVSEA